MQLLEATEKIQNFAKHLSMKNIHIDMTDTATETNDKDQDLDVVVLQFCQHLTN